MVQEYTGEVLPVTEYKGEVLPVQEYKGEVLPISSKETRPTSADIPDDQGKKVVPRQVKEPSLADKIAAPFETVVSVGGGMVAALGGQAAGIVAGVVSGEFSKEGGAGQTVAEEVTRKLAPRTVNPAALDQLDTVNTIFRESGATALMPGMHPALPAMGAGGLRYARDKTINAFVKDSPSAKPVDAKYAENKMQPEESVSQALARKRDRELEPVRLQQTAFLDKDTGEVIPSGAKHNEKMKEATSLEQGFLDGQGKFLTRQEALIRAKETEQIPAEHQLEKPEEGLHSGDLRANRDPRFQHKVTEGEIKEADGTPALTDKGNPRIARRDKDTGEIFFNRDAAIKSWHDSNETNHPWIKEKFDKPEEYADFVLEHEKVHDELKQGPKEDSIAYEKRVNEEALKRINEKKAVPETSFQDAATILKDTANNITADLRETKLFVEGVKNEIEAGIPKDLPVEAKEKVLSGQSDLLTRALEGERTYDKVWTDAEKAQELDRMATVISKWERQLPPDRNGITGEEQLFRLKQAFDKRRSIGSEQHLIPVLKKLKAWFKDIGERAQAAGVLDGMRENYVTHVLDFSKSNKSPAEIKAFLDKIFHMPKDSKLVKDFAAERQYEFLRELEKEVEGTGIVVHTDITKIADAYGKSMKTAILHKQMVDHFLAEKAPGDLGNWMVPASPEALNKGYVPFQGKGSAPLEGFLVHPDLKDAMGHLFLQSDPHMALQVATNVSHLTKALNTVASLFHGVNLSVAGTMMDPKVALKELFTLGSGIRRAKEAFQHGEVDANGKPTEFAQLIDDFQRAGLMMETEDISVQKQTIIADIGKGVDKLISRFAPEGKEFHIVQHITTPFDKHLLQRMNTLTWEYLHTGQKLNLAIKSYTKMVEKNPEIATNPELKAKAMGEISDAMNATFGGLNWLDVASRVTDKYVQAMAMKAMNKEGRVWGQVMLFAPDWTVSTVRANTNALPRELMKPQNWKLREGFKGLHNPKTSGDFARRYVLHTAIAYLTILNGINNALSGHNIWENKDPTRLDNGDGTSTQPAKHSMEAAEWVINPMKTLGNKLGMIPKAVYIELSGRAYPSPDAPKIKPLYEGYGGMELGKAKAIALSASPFWLSSGSQAPEGKGLERGIKSAFGMPTYGMSKEDRAKVIRQGKEEAKKKKAAKLLEELKNK